MKNKKIILRLIVFMMAVLLVGCGEDSSSRLDPVDVNDTSEVEFVIKSGSNLTIAARELESMGYIHSAKAMIEYASSNAMTNIKAGTYLISKSMSAEEFVDRFFNGAVYRGDKFVVQEGLEAVQIAEKIEKQGLGSAEKFTELVNNPAHFAERFIFLNDPAITTLEGYLYPLTYNFKDTDGEEYMINAMLKGFETVYETEIKDKLEGTGMSLNDVVVMASIVEREAAIDEEMPLVASVFDNRLQIGMPLQSCATVQYIIKERKWILSIEETQIKSPYNTYINKGLPIGAIASPSLKAMLAVIDHPKTDYVYFLAKNDGTGQQVYSRTYEEHLANKNKYLS